MRPISFTYPIVACMWFVTVHYLFLYSDPPLPCHPPSYWLMLFSSQTFSCINTPTFLKYDLVILHTYLPMKMEHTECCEMSAYKIQTPENYPEESKQHYWRLFLWLFTYSCCEHSLIGDSAYGIICRYIMVSAL